MTLTPEQARFATRLFQTKGIPQAKIAKLLKVDAQTIRQIVRQTGGRMDDVDLTASQKKLVTILQRHATRIIETELAAVELPIRTEMAAIMTRVDDALASFAQRLDEAIAHEEAVEREPHVGMML
jgi:hypothetical protein